MPYLSKWTIQESYIQVRSNINEFLVSRVNYSKSCGTSISMITGEIVDDRDRLIRETFAQRPSPFFFFFFFLFSPPATHRTLFLPPTFDCHRFIQLSFTDKRPGSPIVLAEHWMRSAISIQHLFHQPAWNYFERFHRPLNKTNNADVY